MEMDQGLFDDCTTAYRAERMKEKKVLFKTPRNLIFIEVGENLFEIAFSRARP